ncbi:MAG: Fic family protein [Gemmatimonadaceae bacterium]|nr:Fic family protein [Gemmatimonadaceae bacterium]
MRFSDVPREIFDSPQVLRRVTEAARALAEFKGGVATIPNQQILINTLALQEAKDSSAIENIVTTHDELFRHLSGPDGPENPTAKEVLRYREALNVGWDRVAKRGLITNNDVLEIQAALESSKPGFRKAPGTTLKDSDGRVVYTPPQDARLIRQLMEDLEAELNAPPDAGPDPLIRMAVLHHCFESIHPFYDGNGRTGRILNVLFLLKEGLLDLPVLFLSGPIVRSKPRYYELLQEVRARGAWESWILYVLDAVRESAREGMAQVSKIRDAMLAVKHRVRAEFPKLYSQDLINNLFANPYTKSTFLVRELGVSRVTAAKYLDLLAGAGIVRKIKRGRATYYVNVSLLAILTESGGSASG